MPIKEKSPEQQERDDRRFRIRHSAAHIMAEAVLDLFPEAMFAVGPPTGDGFYYDFSVPRPFTPEDIERIDIAMGETGYGLVADPSEAKRVPANVVDGQFSVYFAAAATAGRGNYAWSAYDALDDPQMRNLMQRTNVELADSIGAGMETSVVVRASGGRTIERYVPFPKGEPENPMSWEEMQAKFVEWSGPVVGQPRSAEIIEQVSSLDSLSSMRELTANLGA